MFQDGSPVTAEDAAFSLQYGFDGVNGYALGPVDTIEATDDETVVVTMESPFAQFEKLGLAHPGAASVYPADFNGMTPEEFFAKPIGTGPYAVSEYRPGESLQLTRNTEYWDTPAAIEEIDARWIPDSSQQLLGLRSGDFQYADGVTPTQAAELPENVVGRRIPSASVYVLKLFNVNDDIIGDADVREAIAVALDREQIGAIAFGGFADPASTGISPLRPGITLPDPNPYEFDLERAKESMAASDHPDGGSIGLTYITGDTSTEQMATLVQSQLEPIGIDVELLPVSPSVFETQFRDNELQVGMGFDSAIVPNPYDNTSFLASEYGLEVQGWTVPELKEINDQLTVTNDAETESELYSQWVAETAELDAYIPVVYPDVLVAHADNLSGLAISPMEVPEFGGAWVCTE